MALALTIILILMLCEGIILLGAPQAVKSVLTEAPVAVLRLAGLAEVILAAVLAYLLLR